MPEYKAFYTEAEVAQMLRLKIRTLRSRRGKGHGPVWYKVGSSVRYDKPDIDRYLDTCRRNGRGQHTRQWVPSKSPDSCRCGAPVAHHAMADCLTYLLQKLDALEAIVRGEPLTPEMALTGPLAEERFRIQQAMKQ